MTPTAGGRAKLTRKQKITNIVGLAIIALIFGTVFYFARNNASNTDVGDCVKETGSNGLQQVDCGNSEARYKVVGKVKDKSQAEATFSTCSEFKGTSDLYWQKSGSQSFVLCLAPVSP
ncbi:LppU/SCO3897 family protein [Kribbella catacumbae]|uniref:LppU/SCO3897 family protein n=1 Tax=Kribbella catacumbae TaxID=460086 RepID=UPI0003998548|nr:hypothetical protein [Kribbella catacumbae]